MTKRVLAVLILCTIANSAQGPANLAAQSASWVNVTGNLANMTSECGNLTMLWSAPSSSAIVAGVALKGLWLNDSGNNWLHLGSRAGSDTITNRPSWVVYDPVNPSVFWESGIYNGGGIYKTTDSGSTFLRLGSVSHSDYISIDFGDPNRQLLLAGGHEQSQTVYKSTNGGETWTNIGANLPANTKFSSVPIIINSQTYLVNVEGWGPGSTGIYRTANGGTSWQQVGALGPAGPPLVASNDTIYWPLWPSNLMKSTDSGLTWTQVGSNLRRVPPVELSDGTLVAVGESSLVRSTDGGSTWSPIGASLPYAPYAMAHSRNRRAFFISRGDCGNVVPSDAVMKLDYDFRGQP